MRSPAFAAAIALLIPACEDYAFAPEVFPVPIDPNDDPSCAPSEEEQMDGVPTPACHVLFVDPPAVVVGEPTTMRFIFDLADPDGDVVRGHLRVRGPSQTRAEDDCTRAASSCVASVLARPGQLDPEDKTTLSGVYEATLSLSISLQPSAEKPREVGTHTVELWVEDAAGYESNHLERQFEVVEPEE